VSNHILRILILDCDPEFLIEVEHLLESDGFDTTVTWDVWEAIALLASREFDVILVGEHPPEVRSKEILESLRAMHKPTPCIVLQGEQTYPFQGEYLCSLGAYGVIPKWEYRTVVKHVRQAHHHSDDLKNGGRGRASTCA